MQPNKTRFKATIGSEIGRSLSVTSSANVRCLGVTARRRLRYSAQEPWTHTPMHNYSIHLIKNRGIELNMPKPTRWRGEWLERDIQFHSSLIVNLNWCLSHSESIRDIRALWHLSSVYRAKVWSRLRLQISTKSAIYTKVFQTIKNEVANNGPMAKCK